jgi:hypothetical protein
MRCAACGTQLRDGSSFCPTCGVAASEQPPARPAEVRHSTGNRRRWVVPAIALGVAFVIGGAGAALLVLNGDSPSTAPTTQTEEMTTAATVATQPKQVRASYAAAIRPSTARLAASAAVLGRALTEIARPAQLVGVRHVALQRVAGVQRDRVLISKASATTDARPLQRAIVAAAGLHRRYLLMLVRITRLPAAVALQRLPAAQRLARSSLKAYTAYFAAADRPNLVANTGFADLSGVADALRSKRASEVKPKPQPSPPPVVPSLGLPGVYAGSFASVDGLQQCYADDSYATCTSTVSGESVSVRVGGYATYDGRSSTPGGGTRMPEGTSITTPTGQVWCESGTFGIHCVDNTQGGTGFVLGDRYGRIVNNGVEQRF